MARRNGNIWAMRAAGLTKVAHQRKPLFKWLVILALALGWIVGSALAWSSEGEGANLAYKMIGVLTVQDSYFDVDSPALEMARLSGMALPLVGLVFAFSGQLGEAIARLLLLGATRHVVITGAAAPALALARNCREAKDAVILIARDLAPETAWSLRQRGIVLVEGDPAHHDTLRTARAHRAGHFVAMESEDTENLRIEAALRAVVAARNPKRKHPLSAHVGIGSPLLLQEAREMRSQAHAEHEAKAKDAQKKPPPPPIDPRPFALEELAARKLIALQAPVMLTLAESQQHPRPHLVIFGFDAAAEAVAVRAFMSLWSARFQAPRVTVVTDDPVHAEARFAARYPQARAHEAWRADIAFVPFDWRQRSLDHQLLEDIESARGPVSGAVVSAGVDAETIQLSLALLRTANLHGIWAVPIYMKESAESDFSRQVAGGDRTPDVLDAFLLAFGSNESTATRSLVVEGDLDRGAAVLHRVYQLDIMSKAFVDARELEAMAKSWEGVPETYRNANRAAADNALIKLWDAGWKPALGAKGALDPKIEDDMLWRLAETEHARWMAERLMSGWRPGEKRNNKLMVHPNIRPWAELDDELRDRDMVQVRAAALAARVMHPKGFALR
jgi:hypothetical protein